MTTFTRPIVEILVQSAGRKQTITYGGIVAGLRARGLPLDPRGIGRQLFAVHRVLLEQAAAQGIVVPPLTAIAVAASGEPGNGLAPVLTEWLVATNAFPAMVADSQAAANAGAAPPGHVLRFAQHQVTAFTGWNDFVALIPEAAFNEARAGHHSEIEES